MGLIIFGALALYLLIAVVVIWSVAHAASKSSRSGWRWGAGAALVMYLIPLWDWIPTVVTHQYYCSTEAGFWIYKTPEQWKKENPGVMETLTTQKVWPSKHMGDMKNYVSTDSINQRFNYIFHKNGPRFINIWRHEQALVDSQTGFVLATQINFSTGNGNVGGELELRFWLHSDHCANGRDQAIAFVKFLEQFKGLEK